MLVAWYLVFSCLITSYRTKVASVAKCNNFEEQRAKQLTATVLKRHIDTFTAAISFLCALAWNEALLDSLPSGTAAKPERFWAWMYVWALLMMASLLLCLTESLTGRAQTKVGTIKVSKLDLTEQQQSAIIHLETCQQLSKNLRTMFGWLIAIAFNQAFSQTLQLSFGKRIEEKPAEPFYYWLFFAFVVVLFAGVFIPLRNRAHSIPKVMSFFLLRNSANI